MLTGDTILDFGNSGASILNATNIYIAAGVTVTVQKWDSEVDFLYAQSDFRQNNSSGTLSVFNQIGTGTSYVPEDQVYFPGTNSANGSNTTWTNNSYYADSNGAYQDKQIRPVPEPSTYGAIFLGASLALLGFRRARQRRPAKD